MKWNLAAAFDVPLDKAVVRDEDGEPVRPPQIGYASIFLLLTAAAMFAYPLISLKYSTTIKQILKENDAKAKQPTLLTANDLETALRDYRKSYVLLGVELAIVFAIAVYMMYRGKGWPRWLLIAIGVATVLPLRVLDLLGKGPLILRSLNALSAVTFVIALSLLFALPTRAYFRAKREIFQAELEAERSQRTQLRKEESAAKQETAKQETAKQETAKQETAKQETAKQETAEPAAEGLPKPAQQRVDRNAEDVESPADGDSLGDDPQKEG